METKTLKSLFFDHSPEARTRPLDVRPNLFSGD